MTYCIAVIQILVKYFLSQSDRCFTPALHFVSSPVKLLRKTHQEMDFHKENPKLAEELKFHRMTSLLLHFNLSPLDVNRHSFNQIDGQ